VPPQPPEDVTFTPATASEILEELRSISQEINILKQIIIPGKRGSTFLPTDAEHKRDWLTVAEFAQRVGLAPQTIQRRIRDGAFSKKALRNIGSKDRPIYRLHSRWATEEFHNNPVRFKNL
jgi:hypothetical protein